jgi:hypothetical protein
MSYDQRPADTEYGEYYRRYVQLVPEGNIVAILATQLEDTLALVRNMTDEQARSSYAPGKWSIKSALGHCADTERVLAYRALRIARGDVTPLPGFEQNAFAENAGYDDRPLPSVIAEFAAVRGATVALLAGLPPAAWGREGMASDMPVTVRALAWMIAGHELHHRGILAERYLGG